MKTMYRAITMSIAAGFFVTVFLSPASASCGAWDPQAPIQFPQQNVALRAAAPSGEQKAAQRGSANASMVGLWKVQLISLGNATHNPPIPDGALIDFGYSEWHSDGTEILNSGGHSPATGNFCLGVWGQTGYLTFELNHFPIGYNPATGVLTNFINLREQDTLSPSGDSYTGTFTLDVFDTYGNHVDHLAGTVVATRITVDSTLPSAAPTSSN